MKRFALAAAALLSLSTVTTHAAGNLSAADKAQVAQIVQQVILEKPEILVQSLQNFQNKQFEEAKATVKKTQQSAPQFASALFHTAGDPIVGDAKGTVTIAEFFDYQCPHCVDMAVTLSDIQKANPNVRIVYKEWPIRGPGSELGSRAALAANLQGKYSVMHHALLTANKQITPELIEQLAKANGLDVAQLKKDMDSEQINNQIKANQKLAQDLKLFGTPAFFIGATNGKGDGINYVPGQLNQAQLQDLINKANKAS